ncbi:hypothetical protein MUY27_10160 [Mucilaginibacter sp. RS28]|uniref:Uncharacterized protein n=1 Tax=Mucilaginibacter straminoryzae TaxID=2932774 RepID=A0A9X1X2I8_9SPHI|nr:hypothetical protein [Mucilaginibacter straminoryzae]MCJ8210072.1 hypothetical protein [Mucilaginibacter straminoryzae]
MNKKGFIIGIGVGVAIGVALKNFAVGTGIGAALALLFSGELQKCFGRRATKDDKL